MSDRMDVFRQNERDANRYTAVCTLAAAGVALLMWLLNSLDFFIVDKSMMNLTMPIGTLLFALPFVMVKCGANSGSWLKYLIMLCFLAGIAILSSLLTIQLILAWACPVILSCHYYSPRFTGFTLAAALILMLASVYVGLYFGVWDANMMRSSEEVTGFAERAAFIRAAGEAGDNILLRVFNFYYLPRAVILAVIFFIGLTLSGRTHRLLRQQEADSRERERLDAELHVAARIQSAMLPHVFPAFPDRDEFEVFADMRPAKEVGGDFYDFFPVDEDHLALVMADVSGKGVPAALFMAIARTLIKSALLEGLSPGQALERVNNQLCEDNEAQMFVTAWLGVYRISDGRLTASNAGHEFPVIRAKGDPFVLLRDRHGFVLAGQKNTAYHDYVLELQPGDSIFVYTDGVTEATDAGGLLYGTDRLLEALNREPDAPCDRLIGGVREDIAAFVGEAAQFDDLTMLCLTRKR